MIHKLATISDWIAGAVELAILTGCTVAWWNGAGIWALVAMGGWASCLTSRIQRVLFLRTVRDVLLREDFEAQRIGGNR